MTARNVSQKSDFRVESTRFFLHKLSRMDRIFKCSYLELKKMNKNSVFVYL